MKEIILRDMVRGASAIQHETSGVIETVWENDEFVLSTELVEITKDSLDSVTIEPDGTIIFEDFKFSLLKTESVKPNAIKIACELNGYLSLQEIHKKKFIDKCGREVHVDLSDSDNDFMIDSIVNLLTERCSIKTISKIKNNLIANGLASVDSWGRDRIIFELREGKVGIIYIAGQDYVSEIKRIRKSLI